MKYANFIDTVGILASQLSFLWKAVSEDETRHVMQYIYIEPSDKGEGLLQAVATDGRHIHLVNPLNKAAADVFGITTGYWRVFKDSRRLWAAKLEDSEATELNYPNWRRVIPNGEGIVYRTTFRGFSLKCSKHCYGDLARFFHDFPEATALNLEYLVSLGVDIEWNVEWYGHDKALVFTEGDRKAVIQPMNLK